MATYSQTDFERIAAAIAIDVDRVARQGCQFEAAARWYRLDKRRSRRIAPVRMVRKLGQVEKNVCRLLKSLGVNNPDDAIDGPGDPELLDALVLESEPNENPVIEATRRFGDLAEIVQAVAVAAEFGRRAKESAIEVTELGKLTVREGNPGDFAVNGWIAAMMSLYRATIGKEPATSVNGAGQPDEGIASGPFIRFLKGAGKAVGIKYSEDAWRSRVRTIQKGASRKN